MIDQLVIYQAKNGVIELKIDQFNETIWANLNEIFILFGIDKSARNIICQDAF